MTVEQLIAQLQQLAAQGHANALVRGADWDNNSLGDVLAVNYAQLDEDACVVLTFEARTDELG